MATTLLDKLMTVNSETVETAEGILLSVEPWVTRDEAKNVIEVPEDRKSYRIRVKIGEEVKSAFVFKSNFMGNVIPMFDRTGLPVTLTMVSNEYTSKKTGDEVDGTRITSIQYDISTLSRNALAMQLSQTGTTFNL